MKPIFVNGCFDVLHRGHIELFKYAKSLGTKLIVAIDSDKRVNEMKGKDRPFNHQEDRKFILESIRYIDQVVIFNDEKELENLTYQHKPDIMVVGSDWNGKKVVGSEYAKQVKYFERIGDYSTTKILQGSSHR
jgi:D-beta-D-heptose 7-phosphate kinase/D-beta-D-heptose 1-phosphate adenosyltransferase